MNLTYFVMIEMQEATHDRQGRIVGRLGSYINMTDYISSINQDSQRLFFNENAAKGISEYLEAYGLEEKLEAKIVGIPENMSILDFEDEPIEDFEDVVDVFPELTERYDRSTGQIRRQTSDTDQIRYDKSPVVFERAEEIVKDLNVERSIPSSRSIDKDLGDEELIKELMPTHETLQEIVNASLGIVDENEFSEVIISQSESSLAIMQTLMSDDLSEVEDVDVASINRRIFAKIQESDAAKDYILSSRLLSEFIDEARAKETEIRSQYQKDLDAYIAQVMIEVEKEYRSKVPDLTEDNVNAYYESIAPLFTDRSNEKERTKDVLRSQIINEFVSADRSPVLKSLRKFLVLKEQIRQSAIAAILRVKAREEQKIVQSQIISRSVENVEDNLQEEPIIRQEDQSIEYNQVIADETSLPIEETIEIEEIIDESPIIEEISEDNEIIEESEEISEDFDELESQINEIDEIEEIEDLPETKTSAEQIEDILDDEDMQLEKEIDISNVDISSLIENNEDASEDLEPEFEDDEKDEEIDKKDKKNSRKKKKKMGILAKIGLSIAGVVLASGVTFGAIYMMKGSKSEDSSQKTSNVQSRTVGDTVFNIGDTVKIVGKDGQSLDVKIKEFKEDGSAIANDANDDLWLITSEQMKQYAEKHPDLAKSKDKKDENKSTETKEENKSSSNDKKDENKSTDKKEESKSSENKSGN